ncbi:hypothetical protein Bca101_043653 [Brassica carinata]
MESMKLRARNKSIRGRREGITSIFEIVSSKLLGDVVKAHIFSRSKQCDLLVRWGTVEQGMFEKKSLDPDTKGDLRSATVEQRASLWLNELEISSAICKSCYKATLVSMSTAVASLPQTIAMLQQLYKNNQAKTPSITKQNLSLKTVEHEDIKELEICTVHEEQGSYRPPVDCKNSKMLTSPNGHERHNRSTGLQFDLLDGMTDFGYPQYMEARILNEFIKSGAYRMYTEISYDCYKFSPGGEK